MIKKDTSQRKSILGSMILHELAVADGYVPNSKLRNLLSYFLELYNDTLPDLTLQKEIQANQNPFPKRIIKMAKKEHIDNFFETGALRLRSFEIKYLRILPRKSSYRNW